MFCKVVQLIHQIFSGNDEKKLTRCEESAHQQTIVERVWQAFEGWNDRQNNPGACHVLFFLSNLRKH